MSKTNKHIFDALHIVAWIIFVGLCIEAGALLVNFVFSIYKPEFVQNLYQKLDLSSIYAESKYSYYGLYSFMLAISFIKAYLFYLVVILVGKIDMSRPFSNFASEQISQISYYTFSIGITSYIAHQFAKKLMHRGYIIEDLNEYWADSEAFILMAAVIYIIAVIFKNGVDIQNENDLTV